MHNLLLSNGSTFSIIMENDDMISLVKGMCQTLKDYYDPRSPLFILPYVRKVAVQRDIDQLRSLNGMFWVIVSYHLQHIDKINDSLLKNIGFCIFLNQKWGSLYGKLNGCMSLNTYLDKTGFDRNQPDCKKIEALYIELYKELGCDI